MTGDDVKRQVDNALDQAILLLETHPDPRAKVLLAVCRPARGVLHGCVLLTEEEQRLVRSAICPHEGSYDLADLARAVLRETPARDFETFVVLGECQHGVDLDREACPHGCRV